MEILEMEYLVEALHLHRRFGDRLAVRDVSFSVAPGEIYGLVGPDGAGKTTTLRLLCGAYHPTPGGPSPTQIRINGFDLLQTPESARAQIGYLSQRFSLYEDLTVLENIRFFAEMRGLPSGEWRPRCMEIIDFVGLAIFKDRLAKELSGGMKQKLGLATALVSKPHILLLDEPTTGVDPVTRQDFWQLIINLVTNPPDEDGVCVVLSTPYMDEAARCHRLGFMRRGQIITEGTAGQLRAMLDERILELHGSPLPLLQQIAAQDPEVEDARLFGNRLHLRLKVAQIPAAIDRLKTAIPRGGGQFTEARPVPPTLEDVFIALADRED
jgi:ABC-2 type transport system ATP-binding protein